MILNVCESYNLLSNNINTPKAIRVIIAKNIVIAAINLGKICTKTNQISPIPTAINKLILTVSNISK